MNNCKGKDEDEPNSSCKDGYLHLSLSYRKQVSLSGWKNGVAEWIIRRMPEHYKLHTHSLKNIEKDYYCVIVSERDNGP